MKITAVVIKSLRYSGTTWINCILSSHERAMYVGPPDRAWTLPKEDAGAACVMHHDKCPLWPQFIRTWDRGNNFLLQLAEYSGKDVFSMNNPTDQFVRRVLDHPDIELKLLKIVRDGRANITSELRHQPGCYRFFYDTVNQWLYPALKGLEDYSLLGREVAHYWRYEDFALEPGSALKAAGDCIGVEYPSNALRFWEFDHHFTAGNTGVIDTLLRMQGRQSFIHRRKPFYDRVVASLTANPDQPIIDESWKDILTQEDRFMIDYICGTLNEKCGYERDVFSAGDTQEILKKYNLPEDPEKRPKWFDEQGNLPTPDLKRQFSRDTHTRNTEMAVKAVNRFSRLAGRVKAVFRRKWRQK